MIKQHKDDPVPDGVVNIIVRGDEACLYFADDPETILAKEHRQREQLYVERYNLKKDRSLSVSRIKVTTAAGLTYDGDEDSQNRMTKVIVSMGDTDTVAWTLADNTIIEVSKSELTEALRLAGKAQSKLWVIK